MSINDRIALILQDKNLTANEFAARLNVQSSNISHIITGRNKPSFTFLEKLAMEFPEISTDWLIRGNGSMYIPDTVVAVVADQIVEAKEDNTLTEDHPYQNSLFDLFEEKKDVPEEVVKSDNKSVETRSNDPKQEVEKIPEKIFSGTQSGRIKNIIVYYNNGSFEEFISK